MGIIKLPSCLIYWSRSLCFPTIADAVPRIGHELLKLLLLTTNYLRFVGQDIEHDANDKLFKIKPILGAAQKECVKFESDEFHAVGEKIIPSKIKYSKVR